MKSMLTGVGVLKEYFGKENPVTVGEMKKLLPEERAELAILAAKELGMVQSVREGKIVFVRT